MRAPVRQKARVGDVADPGFTDRRYVARVGRPSFPSTGCIPPKTLTRRFSSTVSGFRYYNPSLQRWMNRDPLGELEAPNLYLALRNCPTSVVDYDGQLTILPIYLFQKAACILANYLLLRNVPPPPGYAAPVDAWQHCFLGCNIGRTCGLDATFMAAFGKELMDWLLHTGRPEIRDILNTLMGGGCSQVPVVSCYDCCNTCQAMAR